MLLFLTLLVFNEAPLATALARIASGERYADESPALG